MCIGEEESGRTAGIRVCALHHAYGVGGAVSVLRGVELDVEPGGYLAITGVSGAGKSTLLSILGGLEPVQAGSVSVAGHDLAGLDRRELARFRRHDVGFVFQSFGLLGMLTARENVEMALALAGLPRRERRAHAEGMLAEVGLSARASHRPAALSGGELQRVAIARALAHRPQLVLADEPTGNLDEDSSVRIMELLERLRAERGSTLVVVTHNPELAARAAARVRLSRGRLHAA
ncbi:MAG TPA: ABC transporter ATP-binding protein [Candidatus Dormibacteraeota bacterium]|nr:ABC transporter ATP-binding protein [Candidatus Dormibacteraeota bacterium]